MNISNSLLRVISESIDADSAVLENFARSIWENPETGYREKKTSERAVGLFEDVGYSVKKPYAITGFKAELDTGRPGPAVALLGELDALILPSHPASDKETGAIHACGHFLQIASLAGAARALKKALETGSIELAGKIIFAGCPAEECVEVDFRRKLIAEGKIRFLGGKQNMIAEGAFDDCALAIMCHAGGGSFNAMDSNGFVKKLIEFRGKSCHAASPQNGINALNAANLAMHGLALMRETFSNDPTIRVHGIITHGGDSANIVPDRVTMEYQIRTNTSEKLAQLSSRVDNLLTHCAAALGAEVAIETLPGYMPMKNSSELLKVFNQAARDVFPERNPESVAYYDPGCTDMGDISMLIPAIHPFYPAITGGVHSVSFDVPDMKKAVADGAKLLAFTAARLLINDADEAKKIIASEKGSFITREEYLLRLANFDTSDGI